MPELGKYIYLDHAAATPVSDAVVRAMLPYFTQDFFNPSAPYRPARQVRAAYETAKDRLAHTIGAKGVDLIMTAGATESINLAFTARRSRALVSSIEHAAVLSAASAGDHLLVKVKPSGVICLDDLRNKLSDEVDFVSISLANNELGTIQPLAEISRILREVRQDRLARGVTTPLTFHTDASQALSLIDINVARLGVDLLTLNAAKCGGPKGIGALYVSHHVQLQPITLGGGQERGLRSGTENVPAVIGFAAAAEHAKSHSASHRKHCQTMSQILRQAIGGIKIPAPNRNPEPYTSIIAHNTEKVNTEIISPRFLGDLKHQLSSFIPVCFPGIDAERLVYRLANRGILVSTGAACAANKGSKSHVLAAIGLSDAEIAGSLRLSLGSTNTVEQIHQAAQILREEVEHEYARIRGAQHQELPLPRNSSRPTGSERSDQAACNDRPARAGSGKTAVSDVASSNSGNIYV